MGHFAPPPKLPKGEPDTLSAGDSCATVIQIQFILFLQLGYIPPLYGFDAASPDQSLAGLDGAYSTVKISFILLGRADCIDDVEKK